MITVVGVAALVVGLLVGLLLAKIKTRWCPTCGAMLTCPFPTYHADLSQGRRPT